MCVALHSLPLSTGSQNTCSQCTCVPFSNQKVPRWPLPESHPSTATSAKTQPFGRCRLENAGYTHRELRSVVVSHSAIIALATVPHLRNSSRTNAAHQEAPAKRTRCGPSSAVVCGVRRSLVRGRPRRRGSGLKAAARVKVCIAPCIRSFSCILPNTHSAPAT